MPKALLKDIEPSLYGAGEAAASAHATKSEAAVTVLKSMSAIARY